jgi:hypothetical protein
MVFVRAYWRWNHKYALPKYCGLTPVLQVYFFLSLVFSGLYISLKAIFPSLFPFAMIFLALPAIRHYLLHGPFLPFFLTVLHLFYINSSSTFHINAPYHLSEYLIHLWNFKMLNVERLDVGKPNVKKYPTCLTECRKIRKLFRLYTVLS